MSVTGEIKNLYSDKDKTRVLLPRTKTKAVSDENGVGLDVLLDEMNYNISNKAPAGYGYGEAKYLIWWDDSDGTKLENTLDNFFDDINMHDKIYRFTLVDYPACIVSGQGGYADIVCTDMTDGAPQSIIITYYAVTTGDVSGMAIATKKKHSGVWYPWEYVNPPMVLGVEYRTTEHWNNKTVYMALLDCGAGPNSTRKVTYYPSNIRPEFVIEWTGYMSNGAVLPHQYGDTLVSMDTGGIAIDTTKDCSSYNIYIKIKYIKD